MELIDEAKAAGFDDLGAYARQEALRPPDWTGSDPLETTRPEFVQFRVNEGAGESD